MNLVSLAQGGDIGAYGELVDRYQRSVYGIVSRLVDNRDDVDDIVQDVFVSAYRNIRRFRREANFITWLYRIAVNTALKQIKKAGTRRGYSIDDPDTGLADTLPANDSPADEVEKAERWRLIRKAIFSLPDKHRVEPAANLRTNVLTAIDRAEQSRRPWWQIGNYQAVSALGAAVVILQDAKTWLELGRMYLEKGNKSGARDCFIKARECGDENIREQADELMKSVDQ
jgi:FimV-like protein